jgi:hypothetical protein
MSGTTEQLRRPNEDVQDFVPRWLLERLIRKTKAQGKPTAKRK